jgi:parallel beta-helix repeat protein
MSVLLLITLCTVATGKTIHVDYDAIGANDGSSWADAYNYLQDALADANHLEKPVEILVAQGTYTPDRNSTVPDGTGDREATFQLINDVVIKGGFSGLDADVRDVEAYETILSGDLNGDDAEGPTRADNSYQVVTGSSTDETAVLDGFVITGGNADGPLLGEYPDQFRLRRGGGMYNLEGSPTLTNCTFSGNSAQNSGGGMVNEESNPTLTNCTFSDNSAGYYGGGMFNAKSDPTLTNCTFSDNSAPYSSGGMSNTSSNPTLTNCTFSGNVGGGISNDTSSPTLNNCIFSGNYYGSGIENSESNPILTNCMFIGNSAMYGGGMANASNSSPSLTNCTFAGNSAENGNALACNSYEKKYPSNVELINCILWDGGDEIWNDDNSTIMITFSNIQGGFPGEGNIDADPLFADLGYYDENGTPADANDDYWVDGDYHLKSQAGRYDPNTETWIKDDVTSPCIDAGNPMSPIGHEPFPNGGIINMGAYGGTAEASKSYFGESVCETIVAGDINGDCKVDFTDFAIMALHWLVGNNP